MRLLLLIGTGSFLGGIMRYVTSLYIQSKTFTSFPWGTMAVNIFGCLLIGIIFGISERSAISFEWRLFLVTGILGGFTTFSAFSVETINLLRDGQLWYAGAYVAGSVILGLAATFIGIMIIKIL